ncbi:PREDICTED: DDB1- and CUL4-associated factor 4-like isoform X1 [Camelina sativa]|uniref:DDB1- and CUL4-associated factor 4-like isoform X1 n=1 Tax=Camelina sativa TaxID=90675 RepID=A0ABM0XY55_CAMSA|nr:PREDICTED: DDB1- and CUL4-associated factor 4-like isoform X1 [Camelina sativa]
MKPELPGFYYDEEKNRYFPIKGPIPGAKASSSSRSQQKPDPKPEQETNYQKRTKLKALKLVYSRELNGNVVPVNKKMSNFKEEIQKTQASYPLVWRYESTKHTGDAALKQFQVDVQTSVGLTRKNILVAGSSSGCLSILKVSKAKQVFDGGIDCDPVSVLPLKENNAEEREAPWFVWRPAQPYLALSTISSIQLIGRYDDASENSNPVNRALITTLGSTGRGSVFILNVADEMNILTPRSLQGNVSSECTIWTADCNIRGSHAAIGTDLGAASIDLETGAGSYFLRSKSDVLALQYHQSGNIVQCGLRNGAIVSVDLRERPGRPFPRLTRHQIRYQSSSKTGQTTKNKQWFELQGNINPSHVIYMPSSLTCLKTLKTSDQYLMASSMDGTIRLYDQRLVKRGVAVQTYEGHVNSHTRIEFGIDPTEKFLLSGGEDCYTRIWSIKSGQLLSENKFSDSVPSVVCWSTDERQKDRKDSIMYGAWLGSHESIFNVL